ncbi:diaminopimelate decarboxylase [Sinanaerobacter sp. ZZT-01]|uniref:diaminopimelate decarboxylase n=1 Tax=Sinanaerobacter sp. ZZT-01 TaxID=3111540 RepID=UPI002D7693EA|nr:diaminopimelate decarboxylase [Sinanaerobacter sp. ZZT-01]WRR94848.1 diaminopimelate decarboxylase [Sinanaerobacter sp. ZZT-01]
MNKDVKAGVLHFDGCNTVDLAEKYGTPLYVYSENGLLEKMNELKDDFLKPYPNTRVAYACKAFCTKALLQILKREGMCIDVVSGGELYTAMAVGYPAEKIEFNGNNKLRSEIEMAVDYGIGRIIIDGLHELALIDEVCKEKQKKMKVLYRITPGVKSDSHDYIVTGKKDSKFGIPLDDEVIYPAIQEAIQCESVDFLGFHFHVGSQILDNQSHLAALETLLNLVKGTKEKFGYEISELNIGGGYAICYTDQNPERYAYYLDPMMKRIEEFSKANGMNRPAVVIEPGRSVVGEAGIMLYTIGEIKDIKGIRKYVSVDGGMTDNIRPALYQAEYDGVIANKAEETKDDLVTICGKCCESGDILIRDIKMPVAKKGDILAVFSTGAYGYSMASNYNKNPIPAVVLVKDGKSQLIVKRQSYEDMIQNELSLED